MSKVENGKDNLPESPGSKRKQDSAPKTNDAKKRSKTMTVEELMNTNLLSLCQPDFIPELSEEEAAEYEEETKPDSWAIWFDSIQEY